MKIIFINLSEVIHLNSNSLVGLGHILALNHIVVTTSAKIVGLTQQDALFLESLNELFQSLGCIGQIIDMTDNISEWLKENEVERYVIIDRNCPEGYMANFVKTEEKFGLDWELAKRLT